MEDDLALKTVNLWRSVPLFRKPLAEEAELVLTRNLAVIESMDVDAVPSTTDATTHINPPEKAQQIGCDAGRKILQGFTQGLQGPGGMRTALLIVDLSTHTCDVAKAAICEAFGGQLSMPLFYLGFSMDDCKKDWSQECLEDFLTSGFLRGEFPLPNSATLPPENIPAERMEAAPPQPALLTLTWCPKNKFEGLPSLKTPDALLKKWHDHQEHGAAFRAFLEKSRELFPLDLPTGKRGAGETEDAPSSKKARGQASSGSSVVPPAGPAPALKVCSVDEMPIPMTWEAVLPAPKRNAPTCHVVITIGCRIFMVNRNEQEISMEAGTVVAGWYKGKFWQKSSSPHQEAGEKDILFSLASADDVVAMNGKAVTLASLVAEKRKTVPDCVVGYHAFVDQPQAGKPAHFILQRKHDIYFRGDDVPVKTETESKDVKIPMHHLAGVIEGSRWETDLTHIVWATKWNPVAQKGLQPLRPMVMTKAAFKVPPKSAVEISKVPSSE